jgi:hypothetical protein
MKTLRTVFTHLLLFVLVGAGFSASAQTVYITKSGEKYHSDGCQHLRKSAYAISLADAKEKGYTACKVCKPASKASTPSKKGSGKQNTPYKTAPIATSKQCSSLTQSGKRCSRMTKDASGKCWQHQK